MDELCEKLLKSYNTNVLDNAEDTVDVKEFLRSTINHRGCGKGRKVLMDLIYNHYRKTKPSPAFIGGPEILTVHWSDKHQKMIYIFGEWHSDEMNCDKFKGGLGNMMAIEDFLYELILNTDVFIDLYFEFPSYRGKEYDPALVVFPANCRLAKLLERFKVCLQYATRAAKECQLARVHYFDVRYEDYEGKIKGTNVVISYRINVKYIMENFPESLWGVRIKILLILNPEFKELFDCLATTDDAKFLAFWKKQLWDNNYVMKEIGKVPSPLKGQILFFIEKEFIKQGFECRKIWKKTIPIILNYKSYSESALIKALKNTSEYISRLNCLIADTYTLARIFKDFDMKESPIDQPDKAHNIIIYAGTSHSDIYRKFLTSIGFIQISKTGELDNTCIDMKKIKQPFFSEWPPKKKKFSIF